MSWLVAGNVISSVFGNQRLVRRTDLRRLQPAHTTQNKDAEMSSTETLQLTDTELIDSLRYFPENVLPVGVIRELTRRGPNIQ